jgi:hypothetical protein
VLGVKNIRVLIIWLSLQLLFFTACQPLFETKMPEPTNTKAIPSTATIANHTNTPEITPAATSTQPANNCTADKQLPDPDVPENYIGWKPGVDFSELYNHENGDGNYMYMESLLNGYNNIAFAAYKRSDNSYLFLLEKLVCRDASSDRVYEVMEAIRTRPLSENEDIAPINFECYRFGEEGPDEQVIAIVNKTSGNAVSAWTIDVENKQIQETSLVGVRCSSTGIIAPSQ